MLAVAAAQEHRVVVADAVARITTSGEKHGLRMLVAFGVPLLVAIPAVGDRPLRLSACHIDAQTLPPVSVRMIRSRKPVGTFSVRHGLTRLVYCCGCAAPPNRRASRRSSRCLLRPVTAAVAEPARQSTEPSAALTMKIPRPLLRLPRCRAGGRAVGRGHRVRNTRSLFR